VDVKTPGHVPSNREAEKKGKYVFIAMVFSTVVSVKIYISQEICQRIIMRARGWLT